MRIAYVTAIFPKLSETFVQSEIAAVRDLGHDVAVFCWDFEGERQSGVNYAARSALLRHPWRLLSLLLAVRRAHSGALSIYLGCRHAIELFDAARRFAPDVIHAHFATTQTATALALGRLLGVPVTATFHADDYTIGVRPQQLRERVTELAAVCCISESARQHVLGIVPGSEAKVRVVRASFRSAIKNRTPSRDRRERADAPARLVCVARLVEKKGYSQLLEGVARHRADGGHPVRLEIIGDGPQRELLTARRHELGLDDVVEFLGPLEHERVIERIAAADAAALIAVVSADGAADGIPVFLMEAAALALPLLSTDVGGIGELVLDQNTGVLLQATTAEAVAAGIAAVTGPQAAAWGQNAYEHLEAEFEPTTQANRLVEIWQRIRPGLRPVGQR